MGNKANHDPAIFIDHAPRLDGPVFLVKNVLLSFELKHFVEIAWFIFMCLQDNKRW